MSALDMQNRQFNQTDLAVTTTLADIGLPIELDGNFKEMILEIDNTGDDALVNFSLMVKAHPLADYVNWITGTAWASAAGFVRYKSADANTLASGAKATVAVLIPCASHIKFQADGNAATVVDVRGTIWR